MVFTVNGGWSLFKEWTDWGECTVTCGGGLKSRNRTRSCTNPIPKYRGMECEGNSSEEEFEICNTDNCPSMLCLNGIFIRNGDISTFYFVEISKEHTCLSILYWFEIYYTSRHICPKMLDLNTTENAINHYKQIFLL